jgi:hypothetical protein
VSADKEYYNPVDGKTYTTEEWKTYSPQNPQKIETGRVQNVGIRLIENMLKELE